jgi:hypothetical protein
MTLDERLQRAVDTLGDKFRDKLRDDLAHELQSLSEDWKAQAVPPPPPQPAADTTAIVRLADALRALDEATSLSDILDRLATSAGNESARAGVFLVRDDELRSFRLFGFPARYDDAPIALPLSSAGVLNDAIAQRVLTTSTTSPFDASTGPESLPPGVEAIAVPLVLAGTAVGALYVEGADVSTVDILARFASLALEAQVAMKTARAIAEADV